MLDFIEPAQIEYLAIAALAAIAFVAAAYTALEADTSRWQDNAIVSLTVAVILVVPVPQLIFALPLLWLYQFAMIHWCANHLQIPDGWRILVNRSLFGRDVFVAVGVC